MDTDPLEWNRLYYDAIEHLLWNPDWISGLHSDGTRKTVSMRMQRLRKLEAPLHHAIHLFFTLAPSSLISSLLRIPLVGAAGLGVARCQDWGRLPTVGGKTGNILDLCQPDIFLENSDVQIAVEVKSKSKSSPDQVLKYVALMMLRARGRPARSHLAYVAPYTSFSDYWPRRAHEDVSSLKAGLASYMDVKLEGLLRRFGLSLDEVKNAAEEVTITWRSIAEIRGDILQEIAVQEALAPSRSHEVYTKLLQGFEKELQIWAA